MTENGSCMRMGTDFTGPESSSLQYFGQGVHALDEPPIIGL